MAGGGDLTVRVKGAQRLSATLRRAGVDVADMKNANERVGRIVADAAGRLAPRRSGRLKGSIKPARQRAKVVIRTGPYRYAWVQEYGSPSRGISARHYMTRGLAASQGAAVDQYFREVNTLMQKVHGE